MAAAPPIREQIAASLPCPPQCPPQTAFPHFFPHRIYGFVVYVLMCKYFPCVRAAIVCYVLRCIFVYIVKYKPLPLAPLHRVLQVLSFPAGIQNKDRAVFLKLFAMFNHFRNWLYNFGKFCYCQRSVKIYRNDPAVPRRAHARTHFLIKRAQKGRFAASIRSSVFLNV